MSYCATCDGMFYRGKTVAVVGGGNTAVSDVLYLSRMCQKVYLIHRRDELRASKVYLDPLQKAENVEFVWDSEVKQLLHGDTVTGVRVHNKKTGQDREIPCDGLFVAVGYIPNSQLYQGQVDLDEAGYVLAGETTKTNLPGVFAVGDLRKKPLRQVVTAASDGAVGSPLYRGVFLHHPERLNYRNLQEKKTLEAEASGAFFSLSFPQQHKRRHLVAVY